MGDTGRPPHENVVLRDALRLILLDFDCGNDPGEDLTGSRGEAIPVGEAKTANGLGMVADLVALISVNDPGSEIGKTGRITRRENGSENLEPTGDAGGTDDAFRGMA